MKYVVSYLDLKTDKFQTIFFESKDQAEIKYNEVKKDKNCMSELIMTISEYEKLEANLAELDELYDDGF